SPLLSTADQPALAKPPDSPYQIL
ncbi:hypothetical protein BN1723_018806, partial [Verticillium longisporum]